MKIEILGMGCARCKNLYDNVKIAVDEAGVQADILKVEDIERITEYGIMATPALVIDGEVKVSGRIPEPDEVKKWIS